MKNIKRKKLSLDKVRVAKLNHPEKIRGGALTTNSLKCDTVMDCGVSTKTVSLGYTANCLPPGDDNDDPK